MSGITQMLWVGRAGAFYTITVADGGGSGLAGYAADPGGAGTFGSLAPSSGFRGRTIRGLYAQNVFDMVVQISGVTTQNFFTEIEIEDGTGVVRSYLTAAASFATAANTFWTWGGGSNPVYTSGDAGEVRSARLL